MEMVTRIIKNCKILNEGKILEGDVLVRHGRIEKIEAGISVKHEKVLDAEGKFLLPGMIDDQVHFREPGLTHKGDLSSEPAAAVAGGITSFMEMPNTVPNAITIELLEEKFAVASKKSLGNYSFFLGASNSNIHEIRRVDPEHICGVKIFMGSSTGSLLVDDENALEAIFREAPGMVTTHCEDEATIKRNTERIRQEFGDFPSPSVHPLLRNAEGCLISTTKAVNLAKKHGTKLHVLHISTAAELELFEKGGDISTKQITCEACVHHLWFNDRDYEKSGNLIKWNPAIKSETDRKALLKAIEEDRIDLIATDHAPHTLEEKQQDYFRCPAGGPLVQHAWPALFELSLKGEASLLKLVTKTAHAPALRYGIVDRGFIREGYHADLFLLDPNSPWKVEKENILYKCGWSPFLGITFSGRVTSTLVNGNLVWHEGKFTGNEPGMRLRFLR